MGLGLALLGAGAPLAAAPRVIIITPHVDAIREEFAPGFARWHQERHGEPAAVDWRFLGGTSDSLRFVRSEFSQKPDGIGIDCFFGGGLEPFLLLAENKLAVAYQPPPDILDRIPQQINGVEVYDAGHTWYGTVISSFGILQNTRVQRQLRLPFVRRWEDLAQPTLAGWVGAGDPRRSGTMAVMFEAFFQYFGWERGWQVLTQIAGNVRSFDRVSSTTAKDVTLGETAYGFAIDFYGITQVAYAGNTNLSFALAQDFTALNPDCIAILRGAPNLRTAQRFVDYVLSPEGQRLWFLPRGHPEGPRKHAIERMCVRPDFYAQYRGVSNIEFSPFDLPPTFRYDAQLSKARRSVVADLVGALLVDTHTELRAAWQALIQRGLPASGLAVLGRVPVAEAEALALAAAAWHDPAVRNARKIEWQRWAQAKYRQLASGTGPGTQR